MQQLIPNTMKIILLFLSFVIFTIYMVDCDSDYSEFSVELIESDMKNLNDLFDYVFQYIQQSRLVALHKYRKGLEIHQPKQDRFFLNLAEQQATKVEVPLDEAVEFVSDLLHAGKLVECVLTYDWYSRLYFEDTYHPYARDVNITETRKLQEDIQGSVVETFGSIIHLQKTELCSQNVALMLFRRNETKNKLFRIAAQRAMGNFCKIILSHG